MFSIRESSSKKELGVIQIGEFGVNFDSREISNEQWVKRITPKSNQVLLLLSQHAGQVVTHQQFMDNVWQGSFRSQDILAHSIREIRKVFGDQASQPNYIETIPKLGYRLIAKTENFHPNDKSHLNFLFKSFRGLTQTKLKRRLFITSLVVLIGFVVSVVVDSSLPRSQQVIPNLNYESVPITSSPGYETQPAFSPQGEKIVYSAKLANSDQYDLYIKDLNTQDSMQLTNTVERDEFSAAWSPKGTQIAYLAFEGGDCSVYVVSLSNKNAKQLNGCANAKVTSLDWSLDGNKIAFSYAQGGPGNVGLYYYDLRSDQLVSFNIPMKSAYSDHSPRFSKNGKSLAFLRSSSSESNLHLMSLRSDKQVPKIEKLTHFNGHVVGLDWLYNDQQLIFSAPTSSGRKLHALDLESRQLTEVIDYDARLPKGQPNTKNIAYVDYQFTSGILHYNLADHNKAQPNDLFTSTRWDHSPNINPQGDRVLFISSRSGNDEIWLGDVETSTVQQISNSGKHRLSHPRWSRNGDYFLYLEEPNQPLIKGNTELVLFDIRSKTTARIKNLGNVKFASFSYHNDLIFYATEDLDQWQNYALDPKTGENNLIFVEGGVNPIDPLGDGFLYYTKSGIAGLWRKNRESGDEQLLTDAIGFWNLTSWAINSHGIYFAGMCGSDNLFGICYIDWQRPAPQRLATLDPNLGITGLSLDYNAKTLLLSTSKYVASDIILLAIDS